MASGTLGNTDRRRECAHGLSLALGSGILPRGRSGRYLERRYPAPRTVLSGHSDLLHASLDPAEDSSFERTHARMAFTNHEVLGIGLHDCWRRCIFCVLHHIPILV